MSERDEPNLRIEQSEIVGVGSDDLLNLLHIVAELVEDHFSGPPLVMESRSGIQIG